MSLVAVAVRMQHRSLLMLFRREMNCFTAVHPAILHDPNKARHNDAAHAEEHPAFGPLVAVNSCPLQLLSHSYAAAAGTHDNETAVGWWRDSATEKDKSYLKRYLNTTGKDVAGDFIREAFKSVSKSSIVMIQASVLGHAVADV